MNDLLNIDVTLPTTDLPSLDYFLIDGSGSMQGKWWDMLSAITAYTETVLAAGQNPRAIAHIFDTGDMEYIQIDSPLKEWPSFANQPLVAHWGGTPLFDAINLMGRRLAALAPARATIVIVTDGFESDSTHTTVTEARAILDWCRAQGWQVVFMGCDFNNSTQAKALGADESNALGVRRELLAEAGKLLGLKRAAYGNGAEGIGFTSDERTTFGGYLSAPEGK